MLASSNYSCRHDVPPEVALEALVDHDGPLLLDLDETAYLRNSTEDFLDTASPGLVALIVLRMLEAIRPWHWTGGEATRDHWRVRVVTVLIPWTWILWRRRVKSLAAQFANRPLLEAVARRRGPTLIVTTGFQPIVTPLIAALGLDEKQVVASRLTTTKDRLRGKLARALDALGEETVAKSAVITDSIDDLPLLDRCARPLRTVWKDARYRCALSRIYLPGQYLSQIKRPGQRYIIRGVILGDFALWVLSSILRASAPLVHLLGLLALLISFWAIYERGYVDNDSVALHYEKDPKLSDTFGKLDVATPPLQPWIWAVLFGVAAIFLLNEPGEPPLRDFAVWAAILLGVHFGFRLYNRWDKSSRVWLYPALQFARAASFTVVVPVDLPASLALGAHVIARWIPYYVYRTAGTQWPDVPFFLMDLGFYIVLWMTVAIAHDFASVCTPTALLLLLWNVFRARKQLRHVLAAVHRIDGKKLAAAASSLPIQHGITQNDSLESRK